MKKMTFAFACASMLALFADPFRPTVADFEHYATTNIGGADDAGGTDGNVYWQYVAASGSEDTSAVTAYGGDNLARPTGSSLSGEIGNKYLNLSTEGGTLWRSFNAVEGEGLGAAQAIPEDTAEKEGGLYIDTMVQFTATEDGQAPETADDDKLAIWLASDETGTRLMVKGSKLDADLDTEATTSEVASYEISNPEVTITAGAWYRLTVKAVKNIFNANAPSEYVPAFEIYVDGKLMAVTGEGAAVATDDFIAFYSEDPSAGLPDCLGANKAKLTAGTLIPSMAGYSGVDNSALQAVGFKGSGVIDDLVLTDENPLQQEAGEDYPEYIDITDETAKAKFDAWATAKSIAAADRKTASKEAYLLNCAPTADAVDAAKAAFKIVSIEQNEEGDWVVTVTGDKTDGDEYENGTIEIQGATTLEGPWAKDTADAKFFKAVLK